MSNEFHWSLVGACRANQSLLWVQFFFLFSHPNFNSKTKMVQNSKKLTFVHSFKPVYILCRIFGFMPFTIAYDANGAIRTARIGVIDFIWFIISIGMYLSSALYFVIYVRRLPIPNKRATLVYGTRFIVLFRKLFNCLCIVIDMCNRFKLVKILKNINIFDDKVSQSFLFKWWWDFLDSYVLIADGRCWNFIQLPNGATPFFDLLRYDIDGCTSTSVSNNVHWIQRYWHICVSHSSIWFRTTVFHVICNLTA